MSSDDSGIIAPASDKKRKREDENEETAVNDPLRHAKKAKIEDPESNQGHFAQDDVRPAPVFYTWVVDELGRPSWVPYQPATEPAPPASQVNNPHPTPEPAVHNNPPRHGTSSTRTSPDRGSPKLPYRGVPWWGMHGPDFSLRKVPTSPLAPNPATRIPFDRRRDYYRRDDTNHVKEALNRAAERVHKKSAIPVDDVDDVWTPGFIAFCANYFGISVREPPSGFIVEVPDDGPMLPGIPEQEVEESQSPEQQVEEPQSPEQHIEEPDMIPLGPHGLSTSPLPSIFDYMSALESSSPVESSSISDIIESAQPH